MAQENTTFKEDRLKLISTSHFKSYFTSHSTVWPILDRSKGKSLLESYFLFVYSANFVVVRRALGRVDAAQWPYFPPTSYIDFINNEQVTKNGIAIKIHS